MDPGSKHIHSLSEFLRKFLATSNKMETDLFSFLFFQLKLLKKRPRGTLHVISGFMSSEKPGIKICMNTSLRQFITVALSWDSGEGTRYKTIFIFTKMGGRPYMFFHLPSPFGPVSKVSTELAQLLQCREA